MKKGSFLGFRTVLVSVLLVTAIGFSGCDQSTGGDTKKETPETPTNPETPATDPTIGMTEAQIFGTPSISNVTATGFKISFTPNAALKGSYVAQFSGDNGSTWTNLTTASGVATASGLTASTAYKARVAYTDATYGAKYSTALDQTTSNVAGPAPAPSISVDVSNTTKDNFVFTVSAVAGATYEAYVDGAKVATSASTTISVPASALSRTELKQITVKSVSGGTSIAEDATVAGMVKLDSAAADYNQQYYAAQTLLAAKAANVAYLASSDENINKMLGDLNAHSALVNPANMAYPYSNAIYTWAVNTWVAADPLRDPADYDDNLFFDNYQDLVAQYFTTQNAPNYESGSKTWAATFTDANLLTKTYLTQLVADEVDDVALYNLIAEVAFNTDNADLISIVQDHIKASNAAVTTVAKAQIAPAKNNFMDADLFASEQSQIAYLAQENRLRQRV